MIQQYYCIAFVRTNEARFHSDEGVTLKMPALKLLTVANLSDKLSWWYQTNIPCYTLPPPQNHNFFRNLPLYSFSTNLDIVGL